MTDQQPSQWEQDVAEAHVNYRPLHRPDIRLRYAILFAFAYLGATILLTGLAGLAIQGGTLASSTSSHSGFAASHPVLAMAALSGLVSLFVAAVCARLIVIGSVHLYQRYAPEQVRRRCMFKPTCSEYAILAVLRYGVLLGGMKTFLRLQRRCRGTIYRIDYP